MIGQSHRTYVGLVAALLIFSMISTMPHFASAATSTGPASSRTGVIISLYISPGSNTCGQFGGPGTTNCYDALIAVHNLHPSVPIVAKVNPSNGPGTAPDATHLNGFNKLKAAGITVLGYVSTGYARDPNKSIAISEGKIDAYKNWYNLDGIFFDEMSNNAADAPYYSTVSNYAKNVDGMKMTVCNPGTSIPQSDVGVCDTFEIYESAGLASISTLQSRTFYPNYDKHSFYMLAHTTNSIIQTDVTDRIPYVGYMYITNDVEPNPYDTIPPYFLNEVAYLDTGLPTPPPTPSTSPGSPTGLAATAISTSQINLSWTAPSGTVTGYEIERSTDGGSTWSAIVSNTATTSTTYSDTGLASATQYTYRVSAINTVGTSSPSNTNSATTSSTSTTPPPSPTSVSLAVNSVDLSGSSFTGQWVQLNDSSGNTIATGFTPATFSVTSGSQYTVFAANFQNVVFNHWSDGNTNPSRAITPTQSTTLTAYYSTSSTTTPPPSPTSPSSPTGLAATATSTSQINLSWTAPIVDGGSPVTGYEIDRSTSGGSFSTIVSNTATTATTYSDTGLASATQYTYRVSAINSAGTGSPSNTGSATTLTQTLPSDDTFSLASVSKTIRSQTCQFTRSNGWICSITTTYVQPPLLGSATVYLEQGGSETSLGSITNSGTINNIPRDVDIKIIVSGGFQPITKLIHTPVSQTNYVYTCTVDGCNFTPDSSSNTATPAPTSPGSPTGLTATTVSSSQIDLSWTAPSGTISGYAIERSTSVGSFSTIVSNTATTATTYSDTGLASATQYTYRVSAINSAGTGSPSNTGSATTLTQTLPSDDTFSLVSVSKAVRSQTCQLTGSKGWICSITTTYVQPPLLGSATVYLEQGGSETSLGSITNSGTINNIPRDVDIKIIVSGGFQPITKLIHTPVSQTNYVYTCTVDGCNFTPDSSSNTATPAPTSPGSPTGLTATTVSSSQIDLSWTAPSGTISGFAIERSAAGG